MKKNYLKKRIRPLPYLLFTPYFVLLVAFTFYPFIRSIYLSLFITDPLGNPGTYVGLENFKFVFTSKAFTNSIKATFRYAAMIGIGTFTLAMFLAFLCVNKTRWSRVYQTMFALPIALASVPVSAIALYYLGRNGLINQIFGTTTRWLSEKSTALPSVAAVTIWAGVGASFIFLLVGFRNVPEELVECATIDGAGYFRKFFHVYLPIASPQIFFVIFLNIIGAFKSFAFIRLLTGSGPGNTTNTVIYSIYSQAFYRHRFEIACVYSLILCLIIFIFTRIQLFFEKRAVHYQ